MGPPDRGGAAGPGQRRRRLLRPRRLRPAGVDPAIFTSDEDDHAAVAAARAVCSGCPVRLACRLYAYEANPNPYGVYAGETQTERVAKLQLRARLAADEREEATP